MEDAFAINFSKKVWNYKGVADALFLSVAHRKLAPAIQLIIKTILLYQLVPALLQAAFAPVFSQIGHIINISDGKVARLVSRLFQRDEERVLAMVSQPCCAAALAVARRRILKHRRQRLPRSGSFSCPCTAASHSSWL